MNVLAISGSLRAASYNTALLAAAAELAPDGVEFEFYEGLESLPPYNEDRDTDSRPPKRGGRGTATTAAACAADRDPREQHDDARPGQASGRLGLRPHGPDSALWGKPAAAIGASVTDYGAIWAQDHLRRALGIAGARVLDKELAIGNADKRFDKDGKLSDPETSERVAELLAELLEHHHLHAVAA